MHKKILTGENLIKRNIVGPHRCTLCKEATETMDHLFVDCPFANKVWTLTLHGLTIATPTKISVVELFSTWKDRYPSLSFNSLWAKVWITIPKLVWWKLWLARNEQTFNNTAWTPNMVAAKAKGLLLETLNSQNPKGDSSLQQEENICLGTFVSQQIHSTGKPHPSPKWRLRDKDETFQNWWRKQGITTAFFDGTSKGNPRIAGVGGLIYSSDKRTKETFS